MALTLTQGEYYSTTDILTKMVIDHLVKDDPVLQRLQFETLVGNSDTYVKISSRGGGIDVREVGDTWTESTLAVTSDTVTLKVLGGDADIDNFLKETRSNKIDLRGEVINSKVADLKDYFNYLFYYGTAYNSNAYSGMHQLMTDTTYNTVHEGSTATGSLLNIANLRTALDMIRGFKPDMIVMSRLMRRSLATYFDSVGDKMPSVINKFGMMVPSFDGIEIDPSDFISDTETISSDAFAARTGGACSSIFILTFDPLGACGVQGPSGLQVKPLGDLETKDAERVRIRWPVAIKMKHLRSCAKLDGVDPDGTVAA
jgi:hypothetical protein